MPIDLLGPASAPGAVTARPGDNRDFAETDSWFAPCTSSTQRDGTQIQASFMNGLLGQLRYALRAAGIPLDNADDAMLWKAMRAAYVARHDAEFWHRGVAGGTASALVVADLEAPITAYSEFLPALIRAPLGVAAGATMRFGELPARPIHRSDGTPIRRGDVPVGASMLVEVRGASFRLMTPGRAEFPRIALNPVLHIAPDGSDTTGDGTEARPFRQPEAAIAVGTSEYSFATSALTIAAADGSYLAPGEIPRGTGTIKLVGNPGSPGACIISGSAAAGAEALFQVEGSCVLDGFTLRNTGTSHHTIATLAGANAILQNCAIEATAAGSGQYQMFVGGTTILAAGCSFSGNMGSLITVAGGGARCAINPGATVTLLGTPAFSLATVFARDGGLFVIPPDGAFSGPATGVRYRVQDAVINVNGGGTSAIPGDQAGVIVPGGFGAYRI